MYEITTQSKLRAKKLGVEIRPSTNKNKKIDVFRDNEKVASIGATGYKDYPTYLREDGAQTANKRKSLYKLRHAKDRLIKGTPGFYADQILWT